MEKNKVERNLGILIGLGIASVIFVAGFLVSLVMEGSLPEYKRVAYSATPTTDINDLTKRVDQIENDIAVTLRDIAWRMDQKLVVVSWAALAISAIAALIGIQSLNDLRKLAKDTLQEAFDEAVYEINPKNIPIYLPMDQKMEVVQRRLQLSKFENVTFYRGLENAPREGVIITKMISPPAMKDGKPRPLSKEEKDFLAYLDKNKFNPEETAFIIYASPNTVHEDVMLAYENLAIANVPVTVANAVFVVGRGLKKKKE